MDNERKMNILVLGNSGAGKSTLIKAVSGTEVQSGIGEGNTQKIDIYESATWPLRFIDTKGFEYSKLEQLKTIYQVKKFTKEQVKLSKSDENANVDIDAVWYCIEGTTRRFFVNNIEMMNKAIKGWKNIPVFAVITKSYSETDIAENVDAVSKAFAKGKGVNLQEIVPVVAEAFPINDDLVVSPKGIEELCESTLKCSEEAKKISEENRKRMILEQKRFSSNALTVGTTSIAVVVGAAPTSFADSLILVPLETGLTKGILKIYGVDFSGELVGAIVGSAAITNVAKTALGALKTIPNIAASVLNAVVAGFFVGALGESIIALSEAIYLGRIDKEKIDNVIAFMEEKLKNNAVLAFAISYIEKNSDKLQGKTAKEIFNTIDTAVKDGIKIIKK